MEKLVKLAEFGNYGISVDEAAGHLYGINKKAPKTVGFLFGFDKSAEGKEYYSVDMPYYRALQELGVNVLFLDYQTPLEAFAVCDGLILPGGSFASPEEFYADAEKNSVETQKLPPRAKAYLDLIEAALLAGKPILGICAGAQMIAGRFGLKLYRSLQGIEKYPHKTSELKAHPVVVIKGTELYDVLKKENYTVNSRHREGLLPWSQQPESEILLYAVSPLDGIPEAWGFPEKKILCVQWHPEDFDTSVYHWLENVL